MLSISAFSATYVNYVRPGFRPLIIAAGVVLAALGLLSVAQEWLGRADAHGTGHGHRVPGGHARPADRLRHAAEDRQALVRHQDADQLLRR
ncbi:hypothetical protein [Nonomuraea jabiensis]|uniref:hypothetical protein n=1 Tax=Nonomuraea jabiensis TaxID=882448 RepID=UPI003D7088E5